MPDIDLISLERRTISPFTGNPNPPDEEPVWTVSEVDGTIIGHDSVRSSILVAPDPATFEKLYDQAKAAAEEARKPKPHDTCPFTLRKNGEATQEEYQAYLKNLVDGTDAISFEEFSANFVAWREAENPSSGFWVGQSHDGSYFVSENREAFDRSWNKYRRATKEILRLVAEHSGDLKAAAATHVGAMNERGSHSSPFHVDHIVAQNLAAMHKKQTGETLAVPAPSIGVKTEVN